MKETLLCFSKDSGCERRKWRREKNEENGILTGIEKEVRSRAGEVVVVVRVLEWGSRR